jgi:hypothetical protein
MLPAQLIRRLPIAAHDRPLRRATAVAVGALSFLIVLCSLVEMELRFGGSPPAFAQQIDRFAEPLHIVSSYGLFAIMTTRRDEIVIEGSSDGIEWREYEFRYKPGDLFRAPPWNIPHQPRLDWQMWFAALGSYEQDAWVEAFCQRVLEGSPPVLELLAANPFAGKPPAWLRIMRYDYRFTDRETRRRSGAVWARTLVGPYSPVIRNE